RRRHRSGHEGGAMSNRLLAQLERMGTRASAVETPEPGVVGYTRAGLAWQDVLMLEFVSDHIDRQHPTPAWARGPFRPFVDKGELPPPKPRGECSDCGEWFTIGKGIRARVFNQTVSGVVHPVAPRPTVKRGSPDPVSARADL